MGTRVHHEQREFTRAVLRAARDRPEDDERRRYLRTWGALRRARGSAAIEAAHVGDAPEGELVHSSDPRFPDVMADIGRGFVESMRRGVWWWRRRERGCRGVRRRLQGVAGLR